MRENLIGYLLGALEPAERRMVEQEIASNPVLRHEMDLLKARLEAMRGNVEQSAPSADLTSETLQSIDAYDASRPTPSRHDRLSDSPGSPNVSRWSFTDLIVAAGICVAASMLFFPAIATSRYRARIDVCQNNLRQIGCALQSYSELHHDYFPVVPKQGKLSAAGFYAVTLCENDFVKQPEVFLCPGSPLSVERRNWFVPTRQQIENAQGAELVVLRQSMGGSYAYTLGYLVNGNYEPTRNLGRSHFVIMADSPSPNRLGIKSVNHNGQGHNVLYEDCHIKYVVQSEDDFRGDGFFVNRRGVKAAGLDVEDAVVGESAVSPLIFNRR